MQTILLAGFEPFDGDAVNPALEAVKQLQREGVDGVRIISCKIPVVRGDAIDVVIEAIKAQPVDAVICVGQASGRAAVMPERVAINLDDFRIKDNAGNQVTDEPVVAGGPDSYLSTLPIKAMVKAMRDGGVPAAVSNSAGTFVCNHLFYGVHHYLTERNSGIRHGFVHVPLLPDQAAGSDKPSLSLEQIVQGLRLAIQAVATNEVDIDEGAGTEN